MMRAEHRRQRFRAQSQQVFVPRLLLRKYSKPPMRSFGLPLVPLTMVMPCLRTCSARGKKGIIKLQYEREKYVSYSSSYLQLQDDNVRIDLSFIKEIFLLRLKTRTNASVILLLFSFSFLGFFRSLQKFVFVIFFWNASASLSPPAH